MGSGTGGAEEVPEADWGRENMGHRETPTWLK